LHFLQAALGAWRVFRIESWLIAAVLKRFATSPGRLQKRLRARSSQGSVDWAKYPSQLPCICPSMVNQWTRSAYRHIPRSHFNSKQLDTYWENAFANNKGCLKHTAHWHCQQFLINLMISWVRTIAKF
jgi:hypothetical protein